MRYLDQLLTTLITDLDISDYSITYVDRVMDQYSAMVFSLAYDLTGSEDIAAEVVEDVFIRLNQERESCVDEPIKTLLHRFTYDSAIRRLVETACPSSKLN